MRLIQEAADQDLIWRQPSAFKEHYELRASDEVLATLHWESAWRTLSTARTAAGAWTFKRSGFWQQRIGVRPIGSEREVAVFVPDWSGNGILTVEGERTFRWSGKGILGQEKLWQDDESSPPLIGFKRVNSLKTEAHVSLSLVAARLPETVELDDLYVPVPPEAMSPPSQPLVELPLLVTIGFYLMVLKSRDDAA